jgi:hypothetical protein
VLSRVAFSRSASRRTNVTSRPSPQTVRYLGIEVDDALTISEQIEI